MKAEKETKESNNKRYLEEKERSAAEVKFLDPPVIIEYQKKEKRNRFNRKKVEKNSAGLRFYPSLHVSSQVGLDEQNSARYRIADYRQKFAFTAKEKSLLIAT